jgi:hypothetical protein
VRDTVIGSGTAGTVFGCFMEHLGYIDDSEPSVWIRTQHRHRLADSSCNLRVSVFRFIWVQFSQRRLIRREIGSQSL